MSKELSPSRRAEQFVARFPDGLRDQLAAVAKSNGRSMNAEIVARLRSSFQPGAESLPPLVQSAIEDEIKERGGSVADALTRLVTMGQAFRGTILFATVGPKTTIKQFRKMLESSTGVIPDETSIVFQSKPAK